MDKSNDMNEPVVKVGEVGDIPVYRDTGAEGKDYVLVGYKGRQSDPCDDRIIFEPHPSIEPHEPFREMVKRVAREIIRKVFPVSRQ